MGDMYDGNKVVKASEWIEKNHPENGVFRVYWKDPPTGPWRTRGDNARLGKYTSENKESYYIGFEKGGGVSFKDEGYGLRYEMYFKDGKREGISRGWFPNNQLKQKITWKGGKFNGKYTEWYDTGQKSEESYFENGKMEGLKTYWYENGQKEREVNYKEKYKEGLSTSWYKNGQKKAEGNYNEGVVGADGEKDGLWTEWDENGQKKIEETYKSGRLIKTKHYG